MIELTKELTKELKKELKEDPYIDFEAVQENIKNGKQKVIKDKNGYPTIVTTVERGLGNLKNLIDKNFNYDEHVKIHRFFKCHEDYLFCEKDDNCSSPSYEAILNGITKNTKEMGMVNKLHRLKPIYTNGKRYSNFKESLTDEEKKILEVTIRISNSLYGKTCTINEMSKGLKVHTDTLKNRILKLLGKITKEF